MTMNDRQYYLDRFGVSEQQLRSLVAEGMKGGGDWCDLFFEDSTYTELLLRDGTVNAAVSNIDFGCGVRVLKGEKTGYAYAETTEYPALLKAAKAAATIGSCPGAAAHKASAPTPLPPAGEYYRIGEDWRTAKAAAFVPMLELLESRIRKKDSRVFKVISMLNGNVSEVMMYNSLDELTFDTRPLWTLAVTVIFTKDGRTETQSVSRSFRSGAEAVTAEAMEGIADMAVKGVDLLFEASRPKGGQMPVVMAAGASGILLHEAMGHAFEADFNRKGQSIFSGRMGKRVAAKGINIIDDGTIPGNRGSCRYDDEGVPGQKTYMVEDGILRSYLHDRISAAYFGVAPTGNGRRESFRYNPIPRMRCTYMESGNDGSVEDLIAGVKKGIFVDQFSNGQVKIGEGDFTFYVKSGMLIENGRLAMPVKDINIIGNGPEALAGITAVAGDLKIDDSGWTCGKEQSVPVGCGIPSVLIKKLTVGGE
ncbi:MAG: TldD/PmbA family protein [Bacteroidales bacterium]|nr:TldD/PmbA family protein [Bacteroidales bacterium]